MTEQTQIMPASDTVTTEVVEQEQTMTETVEQLTKQFTNEANKLELPKEGMSEEVMTAVRYNKRFKDSQKALAVSQQNLIKAEATNETLLENATSTAMTLTEEQHAKAQEQLDLGPEQYRVYINGLEAEHKKQSTQVVDKKIADRVDKIEMDNREQVLNQFIAKSGLHVDDQVIKNYVPPYIMQELSSGAIDFSAFLDKITPFLPSKNGAVEDPIVDQDLGKLPGSGVPNATGGKVESYGNTIF